MTARYAFSIALGAVVTFGLLFIMQLLIASGRAALTDTTSFRISDFVRVERNELSETRKNKPEKPPEPETPPEMLPLPQQSKLADQSTPPPGALRIEMPSISVPVTTGRGRYIGPWSPGDPIADGDVIPIMRMLPQYPPAALIGRIEGWVEVEFTVLPDGTVERAEVTDSEPRGMFDRNALRAIRGWRFTARIVDGEPVASRATQRIDFKLNPENKSSE